MKINTLICLLFVSLFIALSFSFIKVDNDENYVSEYTQKIHDLKSNTLELLKLIEKSNFNNELEKTEVINKINVTRIALKHVDIWLRYLEPISYKKINGPLPVEWETEVFEKFEKPYKREGAGLTMAALYLDEKVINKDSLRNLIRSSLSAINVYEVDSIKNNLKTFDHFYLCNRLYLLNLATIYTTSFECPNTKQIIPELKSMMASVHQTYFAFNKTFTETPINDDYLKLYKNALEYVNAQVADFEKFDHFTFINKYINPLFKANQELIIKYNTISKSYVDYSLNNTAKSIFSKKLYTGQNTKGIYSRVYNQMELEKIEQVGKLLFYDPLLSGNNLRSCASCHKPSDYFADNSQATSLQFDRKSFLPRNSPSLINSQFNHLIMLDGKHLSLHNQAIAVITNSMELACDEREIIKKVLSCKDYKKAFNKFLKYTPQEKELTVEHITSALVMYYTKFGQYYSLFDDAMNNKAELNESAKRGFNIFMSKAQCATCHFAPQFNGVKPPYVSSEFEVLGTPMDTNYKALSLDRGRFSINPAIETDHAFRTGTIRNADKTAPYMHNGVFKSLEQVLDFYNAGGGVGKGLKLKNQTLSSDSLGLTKQEKKDLIAFIKSLNEEVKFDLLPEKLPVSKIEDLNKRKVSGEY
jgi:cytochrome c peroxidase